MKHLLRILTALLFTTPALAAPPANDNYWSGPSLPGPLPVNVSGTNVEATEEPGELLEGPMAKTVWYRWAAPADGHVEIRTTGAEFDTILAVYHDTTGVPGAGVRLAYNDDEGGGLLTSRLIVSVSAGQFLVIQVGGYEGATGSFPLSITASTPPNDHYAARRDLGNGLSASALVSNIAGTTEPGEFLFDPGMEATLWFTWRAPVSGTYRVDTLQGVGSPLLNTIMAVFPDHGALPAANSQIGQNNDAPGSVGSEITFTATAGQRYAFQAGGFGPARGWFQFRLTAPPPVNDSYAARTVLGNSATVAEPGTNLGATLEAFENIYVPGTEATVWYVWTAPVSDRFQIDTLTGPALDTTLCVFEASPGPQPPSGEGLLATNDNAGGGAGSRVSVNATANQTYAIQVGSSGAARGGFTLSIRRSNDNYAAFTDLGAGPTVDASGTNVDATEEAGELLDGQMAKTVWYRWIAPAAGEVEVRTTGADFDTMLAAYAVTPGLPQLANRLARDDNGGGNFTSSISLPVTAGQVIAIQVGGFQGRSGEFPLTITLSLPPANDDYAGRTYLGSGVPQEIPASNAGATLEPGETPGFPYSNSVWFTWTAPLDDYYTFAADTALFDSAIRVYEATASRTALGHYVAANEDIGYSFMLVEDRSGRASFPATAGRTYAIQVLGFASSGVFTLRITGSVRASARFDDVSVDRLYGQGGGFGWTGLWHYDAANTSASDPFNPSEESTSLNSLCLFGGLEHRHPLGETYVQVNAAAAGHVFSLTRDLAVPEGQDGTIRYFSFLLRPMSPAGSFCGVRLRTASGPTLFIGRPGAGATGEYVLEDAGGGNQRAFDVPGFFVAHHGKAVRIVVRAVFGPVDDFRLYLDPLPGKPEKMSTDLRKTGSFSTITGVGLYSNAAFQVDDIRVTDSWESAMRPAHDADLIINEIAFHPEFDANGDGTVNSGQDTYVEIVNRSPGPVDLAGLTLYDSPLHDARAAHEFPQGTVLQPSAALVVFGGGGVMEGTTAAFGNAWVQRANAPSGFGALGSRLHTLRGPAERGSPLVASSVRGEFGSDELAAVVRTPELSDQPLAENLLRHTGVYPGITHSPGTYGNGAPFAGATAGLTLSISRGSVVEGSAPGTVTLTVSRPAPFDEPLSIVLRSDDPTEADVFPGYVVIPAGESHATLPISVFQDYLADGHQTVTLTAMTSRLFNASTTLSVLDNDRRIYINEINAQSNAGGGGGGGGGGEFGEFIELYDGGLGFKPLYDFIVVLFDAEAVNDGAYRVIDLQGRMTNSQGFLLIDSTTFPELSSGWLTNGGGAVTIYKKRTGDGGGGGAASPPYYDFPPGTPPAVNANLVDAIHHVTNDQSDLALVALFTPGGVQADEGPAPGGGPGQMNLTTARCPDAQAPYDSGAFRQAMPTPGSSNLTYPGFNYWASTRGITSLTEDDDHDGLDNLLEYALGGVPLSLNGGDSNSAGLVPYSLENPFGDLRLYVRKGPHAGFDPRLRWDVEVSTDLLHWTTREVVIIQEDCATLTAAYIGGASRAQLRLRVEQRP